MSVNEFIDIPDFTVSVDVLVPDAKYSYVFVPQLNTQDLVVQQNKGYGGYTTATMTFSSSLVTIQFFYIVCRRGEADNLVLEYYLRGMVAQ